jgi:glucose-1-phosphate thymidylyltransferase
MRKPGAAAELTAEQEAVAETGVKALIPVGRPFLDYVLSALVDSGVTRVCLVIGPAHGELRSYYEQMNRRRLEIDFAIQTEPRGTADALLAAAELVGEDSFLVVNSDTYYPPRALAGLQALNEAGLLALDRERFQAAGESNITRERMAAFAVVETDDTGHLTRILEKPDPATYARLAEPVAASVNGWRFGRSIFDACRVIPPSVRGELELPAAAQYLVDRQQERFRVVLTAEPVLDLSHREDISAVGDRLRKLTVEL